VWGRVRRHQARYVDGRDHHGPVDEPSLLFLHGCEEPERRGGQLEIRGLSSDRAEPDWLEEERDDGARGYGDGVRLARPGRLKLGPLQKRDVREDREKAGVW